MRVVVAPVDEFKPGDRRIITIGGRSIGVFRVGDRFYGIRNRCPHQGGPLCVGRVSPWARSSGPGEPGVKSYDVDVEPGAHLAGREPGPYVAETFAVHVEEDYVVIDA